MNKPDDYLEYYDSDGNEKECPNGLSFASKASWYRRQNEIYFILLSEDEQKEFLRRRERMLRRIISENPQ